VSGNSGESEHSLDLSLSQVRRPSTIGQSLDYFTTSVCHDPTHLTVDAAAEFRIYGPRSSP